MPIILDSADLGYCVDYEPDFLAAVEADKLLAWMLASAPWQDEQVTVFGKTHTVRRKSCAFGSDGLKYTYSGVTRTALPWPDTLRAIVDRLGAFNFGLCNLYPDGQAKLGAHADNEPEIVRDSTIVGVSLGSARDFVLSDASGTQAKVSLGHGSAIFMRGTTQRHLKHAVPARLKVREPRVSITFRQMRAS